MINSMKIRIIFTFLGAICLLNQAQAQFAVGTKMLGLNFGYSSQENGATQNKNSSTMVAPEVYFFPAENYAIGGSFLIMKQEISSPSGIIGTVEERTSKGLSLGGRIFTKGDHAFKFYANPSLIMLFTDGENYKNSELISTVRENSGGFILNSGFVYMVNKTMGLNLNTGPIVSFTGLSEIISGNGNEPVKNYNTEFLIMPNGLSNLTIGFNYFF